MAAAATSRLDDEAVLIDRVLSGETALFPQLIAPHEQTMRVFASRILRNSWDVEDVLQDARLRSLLYLRQFGHRSEFKTWLIRIVINTALMYLRKRKRAFVEVHPDCLEALTDGRALDRQNKLEFKNKSFLSAANQAIAKLPAKYQEVIYLRFAEDAGLSETAEILSLSIPAVKSRQFRALKTLRRHLGNFKNWI